MQTFITTFAFFLVIVAIMAVGVVFGQKRLRGSCGGTGQDCECEISQRTKCPRKRAAAAQGASSS